MVYQFLQKQTERPFLKRYLKRDEILRQILGCDVSLSDSVSAFSVRLLPFGKNIITFTDSCFGSQIISPYPYRPDPQFAYDIEFEFHRSWSPAAACIYTS